MSVIIEMECGDELVEVEVFKGTHVQFADEDVEYDVETEAEFGQESVCGEMLDSLRFDPRYLLSVLLSNASDRQVILWMFRVTEHVSEGWDNIRGSRTVDDIFQAVLGEASWALETGAYTSSLEKLRSFARMANSHTAGTPEEYLYKLNLDELIAFIDAVRLYLKPRTIEGSWRKVAAMIPEKAAEAAVLGAWLFSWRLVSVREAMERSRINRMEILTQIEMLVGIMEQES